MTAYPIVLGAAVAECKRMYTDIFPVFRECKNIEMTRRGINEALRLTYEFKEMIVSLLEEQNDSLVNERIELKRITEIFFSKIVQAFLSYNVGKAKELFENGDEESFGGNYFDRMFEIIKASGVEIVFIS